jgi:hypothetical protein
MRQTIRLNESQLTKIIKESVKRALRENINSLDYKMDEVEDLISRYKSARKHYYSFRNKYNEYDDNNNLEEFDKTLSLLSSNEIRLRKEIGKFTLGFADRTIASTHQLARLDHLIDEINHIAKPIVSYGKNDPNYSI